MIERTNAANIESMLSQIRKYQSQIGGAADTASTIAGGLNQVERPGFGQAVKQALDAVNQADAIADRKAEDYERGVEIPLSEVVVGMQKASLAFEATLQVRNKVLKAYEDILNMPL